MNRQYIGIRAHVSGEYRTESLLGRDYFVVPIVALVEGVLQGMSAAQPELALAEEFGRFPAGWDGRPVVMSHPVDTKGNPVSANSPSVLEDYCIGQLFNTHVDDDGRLLTEAWVEISRAEGLNANSQGILATLQAGENIEVSTGYFAQLEELKGTHNNKKYFAVQRNIVPDHLAFLPDGTLGACSNADGCGLQTNSANFRVNADSMKTGDCGCGCNGAGTCQDDHMPEANASEMTPVQEKIKKRVKKKSDPKAYAQGGEAAVALDLLTHSIASSITLEDARKIISAALKKTQMYSYVMAMTKDHVVYEQYDAFSGMYKTYQRTYSVAADGAVTLGDAAEEVVLVTKILTVQEAEQTQSTGEEPAENQEVNMTDKTTAPAAPNANTAPQTPATPKEPTTTIVSNEQGKFEVSTSAEGETTVKLIEAAKPATNAEAPKATTFQELLANASPEIREVMDSGLRMHNARKTGLIAQLVAAGDRCAFDENYLKAQSIDTLEKLARLAQIQSFEGVAGPHTVTSNAADDADAPPPAPMVFELNPKKDAA